LRSERRCDPLLTASLSTSSVPSHSQCSPAAPPSIVTSSSKIAFPVTLSPCSWLPTQFNIAANEAAASFALSAGRLAFVSHLTNSLSPIDIPPSTACDTFSQLLFTFLMLPRGGYSPPLDAAAWFAPFIHSYKRSEAGVVEFDAPIEAQLRNCLASSLLKLSGTTEIWRAKKGTAERDSVCKQLQTLKTLGLCDTTGEAAKRIQESANCGGFIEAVQSECVAEFQRRIEPLVLQLLQLFCSLWVGESKAATASRVALSAANDTWVISVTFEDGEVVASISSDQLHKLRCMYVHDPLHPQHATPDPQPVDCRFIEHVFACVSRYNSVFYPDGGRLQASQPHALFQFCSHWFAANIEAFASPFNRNMSYPIYYSAFPDVDSAFGSHGSFFDAQMPQGVALCCPPSDSAFLDATARFITALSQRHGGCNTSFVVVVPDWPRHVAASSQCHALLQANAIKFTSGSRTFSCLRRQGGVSKVAVLPVDKGAPVQRTFQSKFGVQM
jgi:hypothetical protein